ncbi:DUF397 domain-containing protein [Streptomyces sp. NPDC052396]|uniref:DUF397 domain-containing protein n=1 Tax=Streptomyces sp. NPDC052396 TaxID=3365689 RepID=UPI0037D20184
MVNSGAGRLADGTKPELDLANATWQYGGWSSGGVQVGFIEGFVAMRDRRQPEGSALIFTPEEWRAFLVGAQEGEFDLT